MPVTGAAVTTTEGAVLVRDNSIVWAEARTGRIERKRVVRILKEVERQTEIERVKVAGRRPGRLRGFIWPNGRLTLMSGVRRMETSRKGEAGARLLAQTAMKMKPAIANLTLSKYSNI